MADWSLRDKTCVVGVGTTPYGAFPESDTYGLGADALATAVADAGLSWGDLDGLIVCRIPSYQRFAEIARINPQFCTSVESAGRFSSVGLGLAAQALVSGAAKYVALVYGNNGRTSKAKYGGGETTQWAPWGFTSPGAIHSMMWQRHMHEFGTTSEDLANVSVAFRKHASLNPNAVRREPFSIEDHQKSRFVCEPLRLLDYCQINDGAVAWIMTTPERARDLRQKPIYLSGYSRQDSFTTASLPAPDYWYPALQKISHEIYDRAGIKREDLSGLSIYDNFSPTVMFSLEGMGFCKQGESGDFVKNGTLELGRGRWPTNTSGGHLSESYMQGWGLIAETVKQLRGECGDRQIPDCKAIQYICATNISASAIFRN